MARGAGTGASAVSTAGEAIAHPVEMSVDVEVRIVHDCVHECELSRIQPTECRCTPLRLRCGSKLDKRRYKTGLVVTQAEMRGLALHPHVFIGDWNYELRPRLLDHSI